MINISDKIKKKLDMLPMEPGIYKMIDAKGNVIYIGKSKMLNKRVKTYFANNPNWDKIASVAAGRQTLEIPAKHWPEGMYWVAVEAQSAMTVQRQTLKLIR